MQKVESTRKVLDKQQQMMFLEANRSRERKVAQLIWINCEKSHLMTYREMIDGRFHILTSMKKQINRKRRPKK